MNIIKADLRRKRHLFERDGAFTTPLRIWMSDGTSANILYRLMQWSAKNKFFLLAFLFQWLNKFLNGCVIGIRADFDVGFVIMHPVGIVINSKVKGGTNITLEGGVVIGDNKGISPKLGNNIFVGSGAKIIGKLIVSDNVNIGANAVLTKSAPVGATMLGIPAEPYLNSEKSAPCDF